MGLQRQQLVAVFRVLAGVGILLLMLAFLRACLSPPRLPPPTPGSEVNANAVDESAPGRGTLPPPY